MSQIYKNDGDIGLEGENMTKGIQNKYHNLTNKNFWSDIYTIMLLSVFLIGGWLNSGLLAAEEIELKNSSNTIKTAQDYYLKGKELIIKGEYQKANEAFKKAEEILSETQQTTTPNNVEKDNLTQKEEARVIAIQLDEDKMFKRAKEAFNEGRLDEAINLYKKTLLVAPKNYNLHYNLGVIYLKKSDYLNAAEEFKKVVSLNADDADAYYNLGVIYESFLNDKDKALHYYRKYLKYSSHKEEKKVVKTWVDYINRQKAK